MKTSKVSAERMYRWALALQDFNMDILHVSGKKHERADAISRLGYLIAHYESGFLPSKLVGTISATADSALFIPGGTAPATSSTPSAQPKAHSNQVYENVSDYVRVFSCSVTDDPLASFNE